METAVKTTCPYCGVGCGVLATVGEDGVVTVKGDPEHPANLGRLCSKGSALGETLQLQERLLYPEIRGEQVGWDEAIDAVAGTLRRVIDEHGPDAVAFYVSGQLLTEDYYVANKLMKGFIGSANIDTNSRLCMSSAVSAYKRAFGSDTVPNDYADLDHAELVVITGIFLLALGLARCSSNTCTDWAASGPWDESRSTTMAIAPVSISRWKKAFPPWQAT